MSFLDAAWSALGEDPDSLALVHPTEVPLSSALPVASLVHDAIAAASLSAALRPVELDPARVATAVTSERHFRLGGEPMNAWAELSGFWPTADGWVRTHANYPHHRQRLLAALQLPDATTATTLAARLSQLTAQHVDDLVTAAGGVATVVRTPEQWREHPAAEAIAGQPLIALRRVSDGPVATSDRVRVLDLTRVIAGPVASRTLALWGADVLRVDPPDLPEIAWQHLDTGAGKRSTVLDASSDAFAELLATADVVITGYRPGSLDRLGLSPAELAQRHPGIVIARLSAWGTEGPFAQRRGFDSIVQAATGISWIESVDGQKPGALPAQALDHAAGYLLAAGVSAALRRRAVEGGSWLVETSLARVAAELLEAPRGERVQHPEFTPTTETWGDVTIAAPAATYDGAPTSWPSAPVEWGSSVPEWLPRGNNSVSPRVVS